MTQEEKQLLLKDLCARLPYGVMIEGLDKAEPLTVKNLAINMAMSDNLYLPYLRPMSSMTEEETEIFNSDFGGIEDGYNSIEVKRIDWLNKKMFDYRGLIEKGIAIEAPKDMYKNY